jgi:SAM-dependent methyltransferase
MSPTEIEYSTKPERYFSGARVNFINELPLNASAHLLEIGCGNGDTAAYALATGKCTFACGVELCDEPAEIARQKLQAVHIGDIEHLDLPYPDQYFDVLVMSEVIEHLRDPWAVLRKLRIFLKPGAVVLSGSPNVAHHSVLRMLLHGRWDYAPVGIMDRTHLRWFTPQTYAQLFIDSGFKVLSCGPADPLRKKASAFNFVTARRLQHLLHPQIYLKAIRP